VLKLSAGVAPALDEFYCICGILGFSCRVLVSRQGGSWLAELKGAPPWLAGRLIVQAFAGVLGPWLD
jgi:hypothetical protein